MKEYNVNYKEISGNDIYTTTMECNTADETRETFEYWDNNKGEYEIVSIDEV